MHRFEPIRSHVRPARGHQRRTPRRAASRVRALRALPTPYLGEVGCVCGHVPPSRSGRWLSALRALLRPRRAPADRESLDGAVASHGWAM